MKKLLTKDTNGLAHVGLIAVAVLVLAVVAFAGWRVMGNDLPDSITDDNSNDTVCNITDQDLCKFFFSFKSVEKFKSNIARTNSKGAKTAIQFETKGKDTKHILIKGMTAGDKTVDFEYITIGKTIYLESANGTWWKQALSPEKEKEYLGEYDYTFESPEIEENPDKQIKYTRISQEYCGNLVCYKYEIRDPAKPEDKRLIWFDKQSFLLRKMTYQNKDYTAETTITYVNVAITEPADAKVLGPNQFILPGKTDPEALPTGTPALQL